MKFLYVLIVGLVFLSSSALAGKDGKPPYRQPHTVTDKVEVIQGLKFPQGSQLTFYGNDQLYSAILGGPMTIQGVALSSGTFVGFYKSGKMDRIGLGAPQVINGIDCDDGSVELFEDGSLKSFHLANDQKIIGREFKKGEKIYIQEGKAYLVQELYPGE